MEPPPDTLVAIDEKTRKPAKTRITTASGARSLVKRAILDDDTAAKKRALVKGLVDGNPPYNDAKRKANGLGWTANLNFMEAEGMMDSSGVPYYALFNGVEHYAETRTAHDPENPDYELWHGTIAKHFHSMLRRWPMFDWNMQQASYQMRLHGIGPCIFDRKGDWRFRSLASGQLLAPRGAASAIDERLTYLVVRVSYRVHELFGFIRDQKEDKQGYTPAGWNVKAVKDLLINHAKGSTGSGGPQQPSWEQLQQKLKNNDLEVSYTDTDTIACAHLLVMELSGKVSHFILTENDTNGMQKPDDAKKEEQFLFRDLEAYDSYKQIITACFQSIGDGTWHSVRGLATKAFKHLEASNRLKNRMLDGAFMESSLVLKATTNKSKDAYQLMQVGPVTVLPPGVETANTKLSGFLDGPMTVDRLLGNHLANNIGMFQQRTLSREDGRGEMPTATQIEQQVNKESSLGQGQMTLHYQFLDDVYEEVFRRAADPKTSDKEAKRFQAACKKDGVPMKALQDMEFVRANRASGYGSPQMRQLTDSQMMPLVGMLPEDGKQNFLEDAVAGIKGADKVRRYVPREHIPNNDDWMVAVENDMIAAGNMPVISAGQNPVVHLHGHLEFTANKLEPLNEAMEQGESDPAAIQSAFEFLNVMGPHIQQHIGALKADPTRAGMVKMFEEQLVSITAFHGKLRGAIKQAQREARLQAQQEAQATALSALDQAKVASVQTDIALNQQKTQAKIENDRLKVLNKAKLDQIQTAESIVADREKRDAAKAEPATTE